MINLQISPHNNAYLVVTKRLWEWIKWSPKGNSVDLSTNSPQQFVIQYWVLKGWKANYSGAMPNISINNEELKAWRTEDCVYDITLNVKDWERIYHALNVWERKKNERQLLTVDLLAHVSMKNAASCDM